MSDPMEARTNWSWADAEYWRARAKRAETEMERLRNIADQLGEALEAFVSSFGRWYGTDALAAWKEMINEP